MPINPQDNDNAKSSEGDNLFYLLKTKDSIGAGNRDENGLADKFFGTEDLAILQNSVLSQQLRPLEFKPGQPGQIKQAWAQYLAVGSDSLVDTSQGFVKSEHTLSWETNFDGTEDQIVRAREKSWANAVNSAWLGFVQKWYIANDFANVANGSFLFAENGIVVSPALGPDLVGGPIPDNFLEFNTKFLDAFWADISNVLSGPAGGPTLGEDDILSYIQELSTTRSLAFGAGSESYSLFKSYYRYYDSETGELKPDVSFPGSILDAINELYAPTQDTALEMMSDDVTSLYSVYNSVKGDLNNLQNNLGQIVRGETIVTGYENVNTQVQVPSIPPGDDPADYKELTTVFDVFGDFRQAIQTEEYGIPTTIISGVRVNFELIKNKTLSGLMDTPSGNISGQILIANGSGFDYAPYALTGLLDTPVSYQRHSGDYLVVNDNESGIHFTGIEKIAADLTDYGFGGDGGSSTIPSYTDLPDVTENDGKIVASGCDLYHSCNGTWNKIGGGTSSSEDLPGCVNNLEEYMQYEEYKQGVIGESSLDFFNAGINDNIGPLVIDACLYADSSLQNELNEVFIQESTFKWGIFTEPQTINISAVSHSESSDSFCSFSHWSSLNNSINGSTNANESFFLDVDTDITGHFDCFYPPGEASFEELLFGLQSNTINNSTTIEDYSSNNYTINTGGVINVDNTSHIDPIYGSSSFFFDKTRAMQFTPNESMSLGTSFTIEGWIYILSYANANVGGSVFLIGQSHTGSSNNNVFSLAYNNNHKIAFHTYDSNGQLFMLADSSGPLSLNEWHHMAVVRDKNKLTSYLNGVALDTKDMGTLPVRTSSQNIHIGRIPSSANGTDSSYPQEHHGYMQDIRIVKRALYTSNFSVPSNFPTYK